MHIVIEPTVKYRPEAFGGLVFIPSRAMVVELNKSAYRIINFLAQNGSITEKTILEQYLGNAQETVRKFIQDLIYSSVLRQSKSKNENFHKNQIPYKAEPAVQSIDSNQKNTQNFFQRQFSFGGTSLRLATSIANNAIQNQEKRVRMN